MQYIAEAVDKSLGRVFRVISFSLTFLAVAANVVFSGDNSVIQQPLPLIKQEPGSTQETIPDSSAIAGHNSSKSAMHGNFAGGVVDSPLRDNPHLAAPGDSPLHTAIRNNDRPAVEKLLQEGAKIGAINKRFETPMAVAISLGQIETVRLLIASGAKLNPLQEIPEIMAQYRRGPMGGAISLSSQYRQGGSKNERQLSPEEEEDLYYRRYYFPPRQYLGLAIRLNDEAMAVLLLQNGESLGIHELTQPGSSPTLRMALENEMYVWADMILEQAKEYKTQIANELMSQALFEPKKVKPTLVKFLIAHGADIEARDREGLTLLMRSAQKGRLDFAEILLENGAQIDSKVTLHMNQQNWSKTALIFALENARSFSSDSQKQIDIAKLLITRGAELNNPAILQPLVEITGHPELIELAYARGLDLEMKDPYGDDLFSISLKFHDVALAEFLISKGLDDNIQRIDIVDLIFRDNLGAVEFLLKHYADPNRKSPAPFGSNQITPLCYACERGRRDFAAKLIEYGADVNLEAPPGYTPIWIAINAGNTEIVKLLLRAGVKVNVISPEGDTPLFSAIRAGNKEIVMMLIEAGADVNFRDKKGMNSFVLATSSGYKQIAGYLKDRGADTSDLITDPNIISPLQKAGLIPLEVEGLGKQQLQLIETMLKDRYGIHSLESMSQPDSRFATPEQTWQLYKNALISGDLTLASRCHLPRDNYMKFYEEIGPEKTTELAKNFRPIEKVYGDERRCKFRITREQNGFDITYYIYFQNIFGEWKIEQF